MCDTFVATEEHTLTGHIIFGKNSDREPNESQAIIRIPRIHHEEKTVKTTYISLPQVKETYEVILSKPFSGWGAEMGANEFGVVIGNEAVFTKVKIPGRNDGLTGMDMIRLALERSANAEEAMGKIVYFLEKYGQDACGGYENRNMFYHNSFIIADPRKAFVLETAGKEWAAIKVNGFRSISNGLTIGSEFDYSSENLISFAKRNGWLKKGKDFHFADAYSDKFYTHFSKCRIRQAVTTSAGSRYGKTFDAYAAMRILQEHPNSHFHPSESDMGSVCLHATGITTPNQTNGSMVAELRKTKPSTYWFTGTSAPCLSLYKPFFIPGKTIKKGEYDEPGSRFDGSMWWRSEKLNRIVQANYPAYSSLFLDEKSRLQHAWIEKERALLLKGKPLSYDKLSIECMETGNRILNEWLARVVQYKPQKRFQPFFNLYWKIQNKKAGL